jgi:glyoxylate carboligase
MTKIYRITLSELKKVIKEENYTGIVRATVRKYVIDLLLDLNMDKIISSGATGRIVEQIVNILGDEFNKTQNRDKE